jgi:molybdate-binding protein/transcriptional regulator with XRE-family HTH domain
MAALPQLESRLKEERLRRGWSQEELARRSGLSRSGISAIEMGRLVPSAAAALALAAAFGGRVEDLFRLPRSAPEAPAWAWRPRGGAFRFWQAEVAGQTRLYPVEATLMGTLPHDGAVEEDFTRDLARLDPSRTLVVACCDPAVGILAAELARSAGVRLLPLSRSSRLALALLKEGLVHVAGVHLSRADAAEGNREAARAALGSDYSLLRVACWEEGVAFEPGLRLTSVGDALRAELRWVGRDPGSGAARCLEELLGTERLPHHVAFDHRGVAEAVRCGWADLGVCLRLASEEAGLDFLGVRQEAYDLCYPASLAGDPRLQALVAAVRSPSYRRLLDALPGYDGAETGAIEHVG